MPRVCAELTLAHNAHVAHYDALRELYALKTVLEFGVISPMSQVSPPEATTQALLKPEIYSPYCHPVMHGELAQIVHP